MTANATNGAPLPSGPTPEPLARPGAKPPAGMFRLAVEASPAAMLMVYESGEIAFANAQCERLFGYPPGELIGQSIDRLVPGRIRGKHRSYREGFAQAPMSRPMGAGRDLSASRRDGSEFPVEIGLTPVPGVHGLGVLAVVVDISARRDAEKVLQQKLAELERANASLAHFAFMASHDIQEPLRKIVAFSEILATGLEQNDRDEVAHAGGVMRASAIRARELVADMLAFARSLNSAYELAPFSIVETIAAAANNLSLRIRETDANLDVRVDDFEVTGDRTQAIRLIQNIVENALKYGKPGVAPRIEIRSTTDAEGLRSLVIRDQGVGFPPQFREAIFEPFKRLQARDAQGGSGLGLAICKAIADRHGWRLSAESAPGEGATFGVAFVSVATRGKD